MEWATSLRVTGVRPELFWEQPVKIMVRQPSSAAAEKNFFKCITEKSSGKFYFYHMFPGMKSES